MYVKSGKKFDQKFSGFFMGKSMHFYYTNGFFTSNFTSSISHFTECTGTLILHRNKHQLNCEFHYPTSLWNECYCGMASISSGQEFKRKIILNTGSWMFINDLIFFLFISLCVKMVFFHSHKKSNVWVKKKKCVTKLECLNAELILRFYTETFLMTPSGGDRKKNMGTNLMKISEETLC